MRIGYLSGNFYLEISPGIYQDIKTSQNQTSSIKIETCSFQPELYTEIVAYTTENGGKVIGSSPSGIILLCDFGSGPDIPLDVYSVKNKGSLYDYISIRLKNNK